MKNLQYLMTVCTHAFLWGNKTVICTSILQFFKKSTEEKAFTKTGIFFASRQGIEKEAETTRVKHAG
jgi:hypothetical protein